MPNLCLALGPFKISFAFIKDIPSFICARYRSFRCLQSDQNCIRVILHESSPFNGPDTPTVSATPKCYSISRFDMTGKGNWHTGTLEIWDNEYSFDSFLRMYIASYLTAQAKGLLLHSASIRKGSNAFIFCGESGAGKSTFASMNQTDAILTDELTLVTAEDSGFKAWATPFWGDFNAGTNNGAAPLAGVFLLNKATRWAVRKTSRENVLKNLLRCTMQFGDNPQTMANCIDQCRSIVESLPLFYLDAVKQPTVPEDFFATLEQCCAEKKEMAL